MIVQYMKVLPGLFPGAGMAVVAKRVAFDQLIYAPLFTGIYFAGMGFYEGKPFSQSLQTLREKLWPTLVVNWSVWPIINFVNFSLVPLKFHILVINFCIIFWTAYLSFVNNK